MVTPEERLQRVEAILAAAEVGGWPASCGYCGDASAEELIADLREALTEEREEEPPGVIPGQESLL